MQVQIDQRNLEYIGAVIRHPNHLLVITSLVIMPSVSNRDSSKTYSYYVATILDKDSQITIEKLDVSQLVKTINVLEDRPISTVYSYPSLVEHVNLYSRKYVGIPKDRIFQIIQCPEVLRLL